MAQIATITARQALGDAVYGRELSEGALDQAVAFVRASAAGGISLVMPDCPADLAWERLIEEFGAAYEELCKPFGGVIIHVPFEEHGNVGLDELGGVERTLREVAQTGVKPYPPAWEAGSGDPCVTLPPPPCRSAVVAA